MSFLLSRVRVGGRGSEWRSRCVPGGRVLELRARPRAAGLRVRAARRAGRRPAMPSGVCAERQAHRGLAGDVPEPDEGAEANRVVGHAGLGADAADRRGQSGQRGRDEDLVVAPVAQDAAGEGPQALARLEVVDERRPASASSSQARVAGSSSSGSARWPCSRSTTRSEVLRACRSGTSPSSDGNDSSSHVGRALADVVAERRPAARPRGRPRPRLVVDGHAERRRQREAHCAAVPGAERAACANDRGGAGARWRSPGS